MFPRPSWRKQIQEKQVNALVSLFYGGNVPFPVEWGDMFLHSKQQITLLSSGTQFLYWIFFIPNNVEFVCNVGTSISPPEQREWFAWEAESTDRCKGQELQPCRLCFWLSDTTLSELVKWWRLMRARLARIDHMIRECSINNDNIASKNLFSCTSIFYLIILFLHSTTKQH